MGNRTILQIEVVEMNTDYDNMSDEQFLAAAVNSEDRTAFLEALTPEQLDRMTALIAKRFASFNKLVSAIVAPLLEE